MWPPTPLVLDYNDVAALESTLRPARARDRSRHRGTGRREHEPRRPRGGIPRCPSASVHSSRRGTHLRRGHDRLSGSLGRSAEAFRDTADLTTLGKVIGGGLPLGAFGGRRDIMQCLAPLGPVYQAGTLSGNPIAVAAGLATLRLLQTPGLFERLTRLTQRLAEGLSGTATSAGVAFSAQAVGGMFGIYLRSQLPGSLRK